MASAYRGVAFLTDTQLLMAVRAFPKPKPWPDAELIHAATIVVKDTPLVLVITLPVQRVRGR